MSKGIVVEHNENKTRYAVSEHNYNPKVHTKIRDLKPGETVHGFKPRPKVQAGAPEEAKTTSPGDSTAQATPNVGTGKPTSQEGK